MKKSFIILFVLVALTGQAQVNSTTALLGSWSGKLKILYNNIEETISPEVLQDIAQWINSLK